MTRTWIENQLQKEYATKLRVEGAIMALEAMLAEVEASERGQPEAHQLAPAVEEPASVGEVWDTPALAAECDDGLTRLNGDVDAD